MSDADVQVRVPTPRKWLLLTVLLGGISALLWVAAIVFTDVFIYPTDLLDLPRWQILAYMMVVAISVLTRLGCIGLAAVTVWQFAWQASIRRAATGSDNET